MDLSNSFSLQRASVPPIDWRAQKLKEFIDTHTETVHLNLEDVCKDLGLGLSGRQARRLFKTFDSNGCPRIRKKQTTRCLPRVNCKRQTSQ